MGGDLAEPGPFFGSFFTGVIENRTILYSVVSGISFPGSKYTGWPKKIAAIVSVDSAANPGRIRIYDLTNAKVIAELTGIVDLVPTIRELQPIQNVPNEPAIWEIQTAVQILGSVDINLYSVTLTF